MTIHQLQNLAKQIGFDSLEFYMIGPKGTLKAKWVDAYMGIFSIEGHDDKFVMVRQFEFNDDINYELVAPQPAN
jgi:hypothetical protein